MGSENVEKRVSGGIPDGVVDGRNAEQIGDEQDQAHEPVDDIAADDSARHHQTRVFDFLGHMRSRVGTCARHQREVTSHTEGGVGDRTDGHVDGVDLTDHQTQTDGTPSAPILEQREHRRSRLDSTHHPQGDHQRGKAKHVQHQQEILEQGQRLRAPNVNAKHNQRDGEDQQRSVPVFAHVRGMVQRDQALNDGSDQKASRRHAALPRKRRHPSFSPLARSPRKCGEPREPTGQVAQAFLIFRRGELGDPMILPSRGRRPGIRQYGTG